MKVIKVIQILALLHGRQFFRGKKKNFHLVKYYYTDQGKTAKTKQLPQHVENAENAAILLSVDMNMNWHLDQRMSVSLNL